MKGFTQSYFHAAKLMTSVWMTTQLLYWEIIEMERGQRKEGKVKHWRDPERDQLIIRSWVFFQSNKFLQISEG